MKHYSLVAELTMEKRMVAIRLGQDNTAQKNMMANLTQTEVLESSERGMKNDKRRTITK